jgi:hypothetical protein
MLFSHDLTINYLMNGLIGVTAPIKAMIAYTHLMEWCHGYESLISGFLFFYDGSFFLICPLLLLLVSTNTQMFVYIALLLNIIALFIFLVFYFPESPVFLLAAGKFEELKVVLAKLYQDNKVDES